MKHTFRSVALAIAAGAVLQTTASAGNNASFVSQSVPTSIVRGKTATATVTLYNSGDTVWVPGGANPYGLGSQNTQDNTRWGMKRVNVGANVAARTNKTFTFNITAPDYTGSFPFQWRMLQEGREWFGATTPSVAISVVEPPLHITLDHYTNKTAHEETISGWGSVGYTDGNINRVEIHIDGAFFAQAVLENGFYTFSETVYGLPLGTHAIQAAAFAADGTCRYSQSKPLYIVPQNRTPVVGESGYSGGNGLAPTAYYSNPQGPYYPAARTIGTDGWWGGGGVTPLMATKTSNAEIFIQQNQDLSITYTNRMGSGNSWRGNEVAIIVKDPIVRYVLEAGHWEMGWDADDNFVEQWYPDYYEYFDTEDARVQRQWNLEESNPGLGFNESQYYYQWKVIYSRFYGTETGQGVVCSESVPIPAACLGKEVAVRAWAFHKLGTNDRRVDFYTAPSISLRYMSGIGTKRPDSALTVASATHIKVGDEITLTSTITDPNGDLTYHSFYWDAGFRDDAGETLWLNPYQEYNYFGPDSTGWSEISNGYSGAVINGRRSVITGKWKSAIPGLFRFCEIGWDIVYWTGLQSIVDVTVAPRAKMQLWLEYFAPGGGSEGQTGATSKGNFSFSDFDNTPDRGKLNRHAYYRGAQVRLRPIMRMPDGYALNATVKVTAPDGSVAIKHTQDASYNATETDCAWDTLLTLSQRGLYKISITGRASYTMPNPTEATVDYYLNAGDHPVGILEEATAVVKNGEIITGHGWAADPDDGAPVARVEIHIDGYLSGTASLGLSRPDIATSQGRGDYALSGYNFNILAEGLSIGSHNITAAVFDSDGLSAKSDRSFTVKPAGYDPLIRYVNSWPGDGIVAGHYGYGMDMYYSSRRNLSGWFPDGDGYRAPTDSNHVGEHLFNLTQSQTDGSISYRYQLATGDRWRGEEMAIYVKDPVTRWFIDAGHWEEYWDGYYHGYVREWYAEFSGTFETQADMNKCYERISGLYDETITWWQTWEWRVVHSRLWTASDTQKGTVQSGTIPFDPSWTGKEMTARAWAFQGTYDEGNRIYFKTPNRSYVLSFQPLPRVTINPATPQTVVLGQRLTFTSDATSIRDPLQWHNFDWLLPDGRWNFEIAGGSTGSVEQGGLTNVSRVKVVAQSMTSDYSITFRPSKPGTYQVRFSANDGVPDWGISNQVAITVFGLETINPATGLPYGFADSNTNGVIDIIEYSLGLDFMANNDGDMRIQDIKAKGTRDYQYDANSQLIRAPESTFTIDSEGNITNQ